MARSSLGEGLGMAKGAKLPERAIAVQHARLKVEWAKVHISNVEKAVNRFVNDNPSMVLIETQAKPGLDRIRVGPPEGIPLEVIMSTADAIHNLNSTTDF